MEILALLVGKFLQLFINWGGRTRESPEPGRILGTVQPPELTRSLDSCGTTWAPIGVPAESRSQGPIWCSLGTGLQQNECWGDTTQSLTGRGCKIKTNSWKSEKLYKKMYSYLIAFRCLPLGLLWRSLKPIYVLSLPSAPSCPPPHPAPLS